MSTTVTRAANPSGNVVTAETDPVTGRIKLRAGNATLGAPDDNSIFPLDLQTIGAISTATFPSPYSAGGDATLDALTQAQRDMMAHPCVMYVPQSFAGYKYWACATPYPNSLSQYENPCVYCSDDGETWAAPAGAVNPLVSTPANGYNADNFIFLSPDRSTMYLIWRERISTVTPGNRLKMISTTDGVTWTTPVTLLTGTYGSQDFGSPSMNWNGSRWELISHNLDNVAQPVEIRTSTDATLTGGFGSPTTMVISNPRAVYWWHSEWRLRADGTYVAILQDNNSGGGALYFSESIDKVNASVVRLTATTAHYKSSLSFDHTDGGIGRVWICYVGTFTVDKQVVGYGRADSLIAATSAQAGIIGTAPRLVLKDLCTRADSAVAPGTPDIGAWTVASGTWGISTNRLYGVTTGNNKLTVDTASQSHEILGKIETKGTSWWLMVGYVDANNFVRIGQDSGGIARLESIVAGSLAMTAIQFPTWANGDVIRVRKTGCRVQVWANDVPLYDRKVPSALLGTSVGLQSSGAALSYFDNVAAVKLG